MKQRNGGFTLLELILVMILVTAILGMSTILFTGALPQSRFQASGREMAAVIRQARSLARMNMVPQMVVFDLDNRVFGMAGSETRSLPDGSRMTIIDPQKGEIDHGRYVMVFYPYGGIEAGTIVLAARGKRLRIETDPVSGAVVSGMEATAKERM